MKRGCLFACALLLLLPLASCANTAQKAPAETPPAQETAPSLEQDSAPVDVEPLDDAPEVSAPLPVEWPEITAEGVNEALLLENLDADILETVSSQLRSLVEDEMTPTVDYTRVFTDERYLSVLELGNSAVKPLYWIIYDSPKAGLYEYLCAAALAELSEYHFFNEDGSRSWSNSKEFLDVLNQEILGSA